MEQPSRSVLTHRRDQRSDSSVQPLDPAALGVIVFFAIVLILNIVIAGQPLVLWAATLTFAIPSFLVGLFIARKIGDETLSKSFVFHQLFCGAFIGYIFAATMETLVIVAGTLILLYNDLQRLPRYWHKEEIIALMNFGKAREVFFAFFESISLWKKILGIIILAFLVAGLIEELAKFLVGRRADSRVGISARSYVAAVMFGALGLAVTEHYTYTILIFSKQSLFGAILESLFRACLDLTQEFLVLSYG